MKYYSRIFKHDCKINNLTLNCDETIPTDIIRKQSGAFIIDGLTKAEFLNNNFEFTFCVLFEGKPTNWFDLKKARGVYDINSSTCNSNYPGILSDILEYNNKLIVKWALNGTDYIDSMKR